MWTPRRMLLFFLAIFASGAAYFGYLSFYGGLDGLPVLPQSYLETSDEKPPPPPANGISPTVNRLIDAFGPGSPEVQDRIAYNLKLELRERGLAMACGQPVFKQEPSRFVTVSPFSIAFFAKPKPAYQLAPGEVQEISTFHAERAVLEFDREVSSAQDLNGKAKLLGMELLSLPDMPSVDERRGFIEITNNQRSADRSQHLVFRTTGPLFYSAPKSTPSKVTNPTGSDTEAPNIWTSAPVVVVDRKNLARPIRSRNWGTASVSGDDLRNPEAIANILLGNTLPPPTITAIGMKIYLQPEEDAGQTEKRNSTGFSGVRLIELGEKVQFNLWTDGGSGFPGANTTTSADAPPVERIDPREEVMCLTGGLSDAYTLARKFTDRNLMVIETPGSFRHDFKKNSSTFEAATGVPQGVPNHVMVARLSARGRQDNLFCRTLVVDFATKEDSVKADATAKPSGAAASPGEGMKIKSLLATGPHVYVGVESEQLEAQGTELRYSTDPATRTSTTILRGTPVVSVREKNRLMGGDTGIPGEILLTSTEPKAGSKEAKKTTISVNSQGRLELYDEATRTNSLQASWGKSLTQSKELIGQDEQDVLTFEGGATFQDLQGGMRLAGDTLRLWLSDASGSVATEKNSDPKSASAKTQPLPQRVLAVGQVTGASGEVQIEKADQFTIWFRDIPPPVQEVAKLDPPAKPKDRAADPSEVIPPPPAPGQPVAPMPVAKAEPEKKEPEKPKPPVKLQARVIESWVVRYPLPAVENAKVEKKSAGKTTLKYEMERTRCDENVIVHQDPVDPAKNPRGLDIQGVKLNLDQSKAGSLMTVYAAPGSVAQVHFESLSLFGPIVVIDQPNNSANVPGYGKLVMPTSQEQASNSPADPKAPRGPEKISEMEITWTKSMNFQGAKAFAEFIGNVRVTQQPLREEAAPRPLAQGNARPAAIQTVALKQDENEPNQKSETIEAMTRTRVVCHRLDTTFDKPIYFNQLRNDQAKAGNENSGSAKIKTAVCTPISDLEAAQLPKEKLFRGVIYLDETINPVDGKYIKAQRIDAKMLELNNDPKGRVIIATGPGEVRLLQKGSKDGIGDSPTADPTKKPATPNQDKSAPPAEEEMKLTLVKFPNRMVARDTANRYQEARFDAGAQVWYIPTENFNLQFYDHAAPKRTVYISCADKLTVSTTPSEKPGEPAQQWMEALGNGEFENDEYRGTAGKILFDGDKVIFEGTPDRLAKFYRKRVGVNNQHHTSARRIEYFKDGNVRYLETSSGILGSNP